ncbi:MAG: AbrB/MazE/SpoVT family DNA-binding domain-containing protein [Ignavibacteria bacterium]|nr:AbrB/MazE/SpoVT family DNA-binding domain-containing protein [Ignavibacteria bacterium]
MKVKVQKWGNSLALRIPKAFAYQSNIRENEFVNVSLEDDKIVVEPIKEKEFTLEEMVSAITKNNLHTEVSSGSKAGKEVW